MIGLIKNYAAKLFGAPKVEREVEKPSMLNRSLTDGLLLTRVESVNGSGTFMPGDGLFRSGGGFSLGTSTLHTNYYANWADVEETPQHFKLRRFFRRWKCYNVIRATWDYGPTIMDEDLVVRRVPEIDFSPQAVMRPNWAKV